MEYFACLVSDSQRIAFRSHSEGRKSGLSLDLNLVRLSLIVSWPLGEINDDKYLILGVSNLTWVLIASRNKTRWRVFHKLSERVNRLLRFEVEHSELPQRSNVGHNLKRVDDSERWLSILEVQLCHNLQLGRLNVPFDEYASCTENLKSSLVCIERHRNDVSFVNILEADTLLRIKQTRRSIASHLDASAQAVHLYCVPTSGKSHLVRVRDAHCSPCLDWKLSWDSLWKNEFSMFDFLLHSLHLAIFLCFSYHISFLLFFISK